MEKDKQLIVTIFMENINPKTVELHKQVVKKYNNVATSVYALTKQSHADTMDWVMKAPELVKFERIMFLDIDAVPLSENFFLEFFRVAGEGKLIGNAQSSNHINEGKHLFAAPSSLCLSRETFTRLGGPSARPSPRGDVAEEYTWRAEETGVEVVTTTPISQEAPVNRMAWEKDTRPSWFLPNGTPYGIGTTYAERYTRAPLVWHCFQSFHPGNQERIWRKCEEVIAS